MIKKDTTEIFPLFTVIIPTENRAEYLHHTLRTCMLQNYENLEVLVSDDGSTDNTREVVEDASRRDSRIRYITPGARVGMLDNFEYALRQVKPGFVIALGGDDGLLPDGIAGMNEVLRDTGMDLLSWPAPVYSYPNVKGLPNGTLYLFHRRESKIIDSHEYLCRQAKNLSYIHDIEGPMFYGKGVVSTTLIDKVRKRTPGGKFYSCPTPDGYSGIVLAGEVSHYAFSGKPFSIYGLSPNSQGLAYLSNDKKAKSASEIFFQDVSARPMHSELASQIYSPLITLMTVDYLLTARDLPGWPGKFPPINFKQVLINGLLELANGAYGEERICRELKILNQIAIKHELGEFFRKLVSRTTRKPAFSHTSASGFNRRTIFIEAKSYGIHNIFDAAYAAQFISQVYSDINFKTLSRSVSSSFRNFMRRFEKGTSFPSELEWGGSQDICS